MQIQESDEARPPAVRFERRAVEDPQATLEAGAYRAKDQDFVIVTPPNSRDRLEHRVDRWFANLEASLKNERIPMEWVERWRKGYDLWCKGQEVPLDGSAIRGWSQLSPAQQETCIRAGYLTIEDLAQVNHEGLNRLGMGSVEMKEKARTWLTAAKDKGQITQKLAQLEKENANLRVEIKTLEAALKAKEK